MTFRDSLRPLVAVGCILLGWVAMPVARGQDPLPVPSEQEVRGALRLFDVPGISLAFLADGKINKAMFVGSASLDPAVPVTANTLFEAASISKPVFAWLVMSLVEDGQIELDRPIADEFEYARITDKEAYAKLTPRMILTHRTGMPNWVGTDVNIYERTTPIPFNSPPGTTYSYSGEAIQLLQAFVESKVGMTLQQLFDQRLGKLMPQSTYTRPLPNDVVESRAYQAASDPQSERGMEDVGSDPTRAAAAYSLVTTAEDLARFLGLVYRKEGLKLETYQEMFRPQSPIPAGQGPLGAQYGLGWVVVPMGPDRLVGHTGNNGEYRSIAFVSLGTGEGIVALANAASSQGLLETLVEPPPRPGAKTRGPEEVFDAFWSAFQTNYALFDVKQIDWDLIRSVYRPRISEQTTDNELWETLSAVIELLNDVHVTMTDPDNNRTVRSGGRSIGVGVFDDGQFSLELIKRKYLQSYQSAAG
ncbi:MAG: serine hydrolase, partial [Planctomycetota bacterium]